MPLSPALQRLPTEPLTCLGTSSGAAPPGAVCQHPARSPPPLAAAPQPRLRDHFGSANLRLPRITSSLPASPNPVSCKRTLTPRGPCHEAPTPAARSPDTTVVLPARPRGDLRTRGLRVPPRKDQVPAGPAWRPQNTRDPPSEAWAGCSDPVLSFPSTPMIKSLLRSDTAHLNPAAP